MSEDSRPGSAEHAKDYARERLRQAILRGEMAPGHRLVANELAELCDVSRASIRAALLDLASEGLVERIHNRGSRVRMVSVDEPVEIMECRTALEELCAVKAAELATDAQLDELARLGRALSTSVSDVDPITYSRRNYELHALIRDISGQRTAIGLLERFSALLRHSFQLALRPGRPQQSLSEHLVVIEAIRARNPRAAGTAVRAHLGSVTDGLRACRIQADPGRTAAGGATESFLPAY
ncbi:GntR family transcriptional regulator [Streptacidiphilus carbonis]|uniref:GntR family transcriptional regulator n=1 Tax=Streptacidiphilus carbonis TaxID=105422 RepID=UPI000A06213C|nr:GntR family transcriptional regulator [Streptacidiphilus carbonis]